MADIYVDTAGSNTSPYDTEAKAATTLFDAVDIVTDGDTIKVKAGITTTETVLSRIQSGVVTIERYGTGANPLIVQTVGTTITLYISGSGQVRVSGIDFSGGSGVKTSNSSGSTTPHHTFSDCSFTASTKDGLSIEAGASGMFPTAAITDCVAYDNTNDGFKSEGDPGSLVSMTLTRCVAYGHTGVVLDDGISLHANSTAILNDCEFYGNENGVSNVGGTTCTINGGRIHDNLNVGIRAASGTATFNIYGCFIYDNAAAQPTDPGAQIAANVDSINSIITMEGCVISGTPAGKYGLKAWGAASSFSIKNCTFSGAGGGIYIDTGSGEDVTIENTIIDTTTNDVALYYVADADIPDTTISYSVFNKSIADSSNKDITAISTNAGMQFEATIGFLTEGNYRIGYTSPCIGTGIANSNNYLHPLTNFGDSRSYLMSEPSLNDIGAFKYIGNDGLR